MTSGFTAQKHWLMHTAQTCPVCLQAFPNRREMVSHIEEEHQDICYTCGGTIFATDETNDKHDCAEEVVSVGGLLQALPATLRPRSCSEPCCGRVISVERDVAQHRREMHSEGTPNQVCDICNKSFSTSHLLGNHKKKEHSVDDRIYPCPICLKDIRVAKSGFHFSKINNSKCARQLEAGHLLHCTVAGCSFEARDIRTYNQHWNKEHDFEMAAE